eukprot:m.179119 g.179119  ORF g.179119 m.179119 type:complete len:210 (+) comp14683_c0_seq1:25-654(+)
MASIAMVRAVSTLTRWGMNSVIGGAARPMAMTSPPPHFNSKAMARAQEQAELRGRPDPFEGNARVWHAAIRNNDTSVWKLNLVSRLVRGMAVDDAIAQMEFSPKKAATFVLRAIHSARSHARRDGKEDLSDLWVKESYCGRGHNTKGIRYHGRGRTGRMVHPKTHYFIKLEEGKPPSQWKERMPREEWDRRNQEKLMNKPPRVRHSLES